MLRHRTFEEQRARTLAGARAESRGAAADLVTVSAAVDARGTQPARDNRSLRRRPSRPRATAPQIEHFSWEGMEVDRFVLFELKINKGVT